MSKPTIYNLDYLFTAEAMNGNIIKQNPDDKSRLEPNKSAFYDVLKNLPLKRFILSGKGHVFIVDFTDLSISINEKKHFCPRPENIQKVTPIYYRDIVQVASNQLHQEKGLISGIKRAFLETKHLGSSVGYRIGFQIHVLHGKTKKYEMKIDPIN